MRVTYSILPYSGVVAEIYRGCLRHAQLLEHLQRQARDARILPHYHWVSDFTRASFVLSDAEAFDIANSHATARADTCKHALVVPNTRAFGFANLMIACLTRAGRPVGCFRHRDAAVRWVNTPHGIESLVAMRDAVHGAGSGAP